MSQETPQPENTESLTLSVEEIALPGTVEGILGVLRRVLSKPYVQSITLRSESPIKVEWYKDLSDSLAIGEPEERPDDVLSRVDMSEFSTPKSPREAVLEAILKLNLSGLQATHLFVGSVEFFKDWVELPSVVPLPRFGDTPHHNFMGIKTVEVDSLEEDVVVLLGAGALGATTNEITKAYKVVT